MSKLTVGIRSIVLALVVTCGAVQAQAGYLFRLSEREIDEVMTHYYPKGYDRAAALEQMSEPFNCKNFGDLCTEVGEGYALRMLENAWTSARKGFPIEMIDRMAEHDMEYFGQLWFDRLYPSGVPEKDPYWTATGSTTACSDTVSADVGDFRVVHTSRRHSLVVFAWGRVRVEHFKRGLNGKYDPKRADKLRVEGSVTVDELSELDPFTVQVADEKEDAKHVAATYPYGGVTIVKIPFVEGCGGVPGTALWACSCSGVQP
jgi:hypothetical protein